MSPRTAECPRDPPDGIARLRRAWVRTSGYLIAIVVPVVVLLLVMALRPVLNIEPSPPFVAAVLLVAWIGGFWPAMVTAVVAIEMLNYFFVPPLGTLAIHNDDGVWVALFLVVSVIIARLASRRKELLAQELRARQDAEIARTEAVDANRAKDMLLAVVSHELRSPLQAISAWVAVLRREDADAATRLQALEAIERGVASQGRVIQDLLDFARVVAGQLTLECQDDVAIETIVKASLEAVRWSAESRQLRLECVVDPGIPAVRGDPVRLQQVFVNLLSNAVKFTPPGGFVRATVSAVAGEVRVAVRDSGIGVPSELLPRIFDRFMQINRNQSEGGLGLGLAIVQHLVHAHGGWVEAESAGVGQGTTFTVALPAGGHYAD